MTSKKFKVRVGRHYRWSRRQVEGMGQQAEKNLEKHFVKRLTGLFLVRRFLLAWTLLLVLLIGCVVAQTDALSGYYQHLSPVPGGIYTEGILGDFTTANPLYATSSVDSSVARLVFSGLLTYNSHNQLVGDLAKSWSVSSNDKVYTVKLKPNLTWQDGQPLTSKDVVFTYHTIQDPNAQSPLITSWQNIVVAAPNRTTVTFTLPNPLASFPYSLTNGIVPEHLLKNIAPSQLRSANFNISPIGSGPFSWQSLAVQGATPQTRQEQINLTAFQNYNSGPPKLNQFIVRAFHNQSQLMTSFKAGNLTAIVGLNNVPSGLKNMKHIYKYSLPLMAANMVFFKTTSGVLSDANVRKALVQSANVNQIINGLGYPVSPVREPILSNQIGYDASYQQQTGNLAAANTTLEQDGWIPAGDGVRYKNNQPLKFTLYAPNSRDDTYVSKALQKDWRKVGVQVQLVFQSSGDMQQTIDYHAYDALLYGISIGVDPDVFAYWDSSQVSLASPTHTNFSEYQSTTADDGLEAGRTVLDPALRAIKYKVFLQAWQSDAPALGLYQPRFLYLTRQPVYGLSEQTINQATDRYNNVANWEIRQGRAND